MNFNALSLTLLLAVSGACGDDSSTPAGSDDQTPPTTSSAAVETWLKAGSYKTWTCEPAVHASREPSPHGFNKICSNNLVSQNASGTSAWPKGAAAVKELYASLTATTPIGVAVYVKTEVDSAAGAGWYWYERVPLDSPAPHDANGVVAEGLGKSGPPKDICVGCHTGAGKDAMHTPSPGSRDLVYTPLK